MEQQDKMKEIKYAMNARMFLVIASIVLMVNAASSTLMDGFRWFGIVSMVEEYDKENAGKQDQVESTAAKENTDAAVEATDTSKEKTAAEDTESEKAAANEETSTDGETPTAGDAANTAEGTQEIDVAALKKDMNALGITVNDFRILGIACIVMVVIRLIIGLICLRLSNRVDKAGITMTAVIILIAAEIAYVLLMFFKHALFLGSLLYTILVLVFMFLGAKRMRKLHQMDPERVYAVNTVRQAQQKKAAAQAPRKSIRDRAMMSTNTDSGENENQLPPETPQPAAEEENELPPVC